jgi:hypothetical protein
MKIFRGHDIIALLLKPALVRRTAFGIKSLYFNVKPFVPSLWFRVTAGIFRSLKSLDYGLEDRGIEVLFQADVRFLSFPSIHNGTGAQLNSHLMGHRGSFPRISAAGA